MVGVLVVDDDLDSRTLLEMALAEEGYAVLVAANGAEALTVARQSHPIVILLDLAMPVMDGFAFRAAQLRDPQLAGIPVICVSGGVLSTMFGWMVNVRETSCENVPLLSLTFK